MGCNLSLLNWEIWSLRGATYNARQKGLPVSSVTAVAETVVDLATCRPVIRSRRSVSVFIIVTI